MYTYAEILEINYRVSHVEVFFLIESDAADLLSDVETHTVDTSFIFTKKSNVAKCFFDIINAEMAQWHQKS